MSKIGDLLTGAVIGSVGGIGVGAASKAISALFMSGRSIGGIIPDVVIEEHHEDTLTITDHPVEQGAQITDHAYKNQAEVTMRVGWSNSTSLINSIVSGSLFSGTINSVNDLYKQMLLLQESRTVFDVVTGKRTYKNMLIKSLSTTTDDNTENALILVVHMRQIIIVSTSEVSLSSNDTQTQPEKTGVVSNTGTKQPIVAPAQSILYKLIKG